MEYLSYIIGVSRDFAKKISKVYSMQTFPVCGRRESEVVVAES